VVKLTDYRYQLHIGTKMKAQFQRHINPTKKYDNYFPKASNQNIDLPKGAVYYTLENIQKIVSTTLDQTARIAKELIGVNLKETTTNVWNFVYHHIQYKPDEAGVEQLRSPSRAWHDRFTGVDCDCYSIFISSILTNLGIEHSLRIAEYGNKGYFQHIYIIVPKDSRFNTRSDYYVIDPVLDQNNYEKEFTKKHDFKMKISHQYLNGFENENTLTVEFGREFEGISINGLGSTADSNSVLSALKKHLVNSLLLVKTKPESVAALIDPEVYEAQLEYAIENWDDPVAREAALDELAEMEELGEGNNSDSATELEGLNGLGCGCEKYKYRPEIAKRVALSKIKMLKSRRRKNKRVCPATVRNGKLMRHPAIGKMYDRNSRNRMQSILRGVDGLNGRRRKRGGFWKKIKTVAKKVHNKAVKITKKAVKKIAHFIVKTNPATILLRNGIYAAMRMNMFHVAEKFYYTYLTDAQARNLGLDLSELSKLRARRLKLDKAVEKMGGKAELVKKHILHGRARKKVDNPILSGLGVVATAAAGSSAAVAAGFIGKIASFLKKINFKKLFANAKKVSSAVKSSGIVSKMKARKPKKIALPNGQELKVAVDTDSAFLDPEEQAESNTTGSKNGSNGKDGKKDNTMLYVGGGLAAALLAYMAFKPKPELAPAPTPVKV